MKKTIILSVAEISRQWLKFASKEVKIHNQQLLLDLVLNRDRSVPLLTVSNHISTLDDPVMWGGLLENRHINELIDRDQMRWAVAAKEIVFTNFLFNWFFLTGQAIPIVRGDGIYQEAMDESIKILNRGQWMHFFPEGRVIQNSMGRIDRLKWGISRLIIESERAPIVLPIILKGFDEMKPLDDRFPSLNNKIEFLIGDPIDSRKYLQATEHVKSEGNRRSQIAEFVRFEMEKTARIGL